MRNIIAHGYFIVDSTIIWETIKTELPDLKKIVEKMKDFTNSN